MNTSRLFITSISISEVIFKLRNDPTKLKEIVDYLITNDFQIVQIGYLPIEIEKVVEIYEGNISNDNLCFINEVVQNKIKVEKEFTTFFFTCVCCAIANAIIENEIEPVKSRLNFTFRSVINGNLEFIKKKIDDAYIEAYQSTNIQKSIKQEFAELLRLFLINLMSFYNIAKNSEDPNIQITNNNAEWLAEQLFSLKEYKRLKKYIKTPLLAFKDNTTQKYIKRFLQDELPKYLETEEIDEFFLKYAKRKLNTLIDSGGTFYKNDMLDLMIVIALNLSQFQLITVDKDMLKFLREAHPSSWNLSQSMLERN
jgi:hypothetical protein